MIDSVKSHAEIKQHHKCDLLRVDDFLIAVPGSQIVGANKKSWSKKKK